MGKKNKGKKGQIRVVEKMDLDGFTSREEQKIQQELEFKHGEKSIKEKGSTSKSAQTAAKAEEPIAGSRSEVDFMKALANKEFQISTFYSLDNKLIDAYYTKMRNFAEEERDLLENEEFLYFVRQFAKDVEFLLGMPFVKFWQHVCTVPDILRALDDFLMNMRKVNDTFKIAVLSEHGSDSKASDENAIAETDRLIRKEMNNILQMTLKIFYRLSTNIESEDEYFSIEFYKNLVYDNWVFDLPKLLDLAKVFSHSNPKEVQTLISCVFENDKRFIQDFKETFDEVLKVSKLLFNEASKLTSIHSGDSVISTTQEQVEDKTIKLLSDYTEVFGDINLIATALPDIVLDTLRNTNILIILANAYCLMRKRAKKWIPKQSKNKLKMESLRHGVSKLCLQSCLKILDRALVQSIGVHTPNFAAVQHQLAQSLKQFVLSVTGNQEVSKDALKNQLNFIAEHQNVGISFLKKIMKRLDLLNSVDNVEDRFLPDGEKHLLVMILESLQKGQRVQVRKVAPIARAHQQPGQSRKAEGIGKTHAATAAPQWSFQDKENLSNLTAMFEGSVTRNQVERMYLKNHKDFDATLNDCLSGNVPKEIDDLEVIVTDAPDLEEQRKDGDFEMIDTWRKPNGEDPDNADKRVRSNEAPDLLKQYVLQEYGDYFPNSRSTKNKKYKEAHLRALDQKRQEDEDDMQDVKKKMLHMAERIAYDDDYDDTNLRNLRQRRISRDSGSSDEDNGVAQARQANRGKAAFQPQIVQKPVAQAPKGAKGNGQNNPKPGKAQVPAQAEVEDDDDDEDDVIDATDKFIQRQESENQSNDYQFQDDPVKHRRQEEFKRKQQEQRERQDAGLKRDDPNRDRRQHDPESNRGGGGHQEYVQKYVPKGSKAPAQQDDSRFAEPEQKPYGRGQPKASGHPDTEDRSFTRGRGRGGGARGGRGGNNREGPRQDNVFRGKAFYGGRGDGGRGRGRGYSDDYQYFDDKGTKDNYYTSENPLDGEDVENDYSGVAHGAPGLDYASNPLSQTQDPKAGLMSFTYGSDNEEEDAAGDRGGARGARRGGARGRGGPRRGGPHDQKNRNFKKMGGPY